MTETPQPARPGWRVTDETLREEQVADQRARSRASYNRVGWVNFASIILLMIAAFQVVVGLTAILRSGTYTVGESSLAVNVDYTAWGWLHLLLGIVAAAAAYGLVRGLMWARVLGICVASLSAVAHLGFLPAQPFVSTLVISIDVIVIYAIAVHVGPVGEQSGY
jgi:predicted anti-sigma-YlaC factor YlaD